MALAVMVEVRKKKTLPPDHAPLVIDIDSPGHPFDQAGFQQIRELQHAGPSDSAMA